MSMKMYPGWFFLVPVSVVAIFLIIFGDNWFIIWVGFELTLICFLPLFTGGSMMVEGMVKYFLVQAGGSSLFVLSFVVSWSSLSSKILILSMFLKLGVFPFHTWVPLVMSSMTWGGCLLLLTIQKLGPLFVLSGESYFFSSFLVFFGVLSVLVSGVMGYNQVYMRSLMAYSSIGHSGWLIISFVYSFSLFLLYIWVYFLLVCVLFSLFFVMEVHKVNSSSFSFKSWTVLGLVILCISGVPPFSIFYLKLMVLSSMMSLYVLVPFLLLGSMLSIYYYLGFVLPGLSVCLWNGELAESKLLFFGLFLSFVFPFLLVL